ncbi:hypothetical protein R80B4_00401 [Fibrobacteres bacterium R8-0-B4]
MIPEDHIETPRVGGCPLAKLAENGVIARSGSDRRVTWKVLNPSV